MKSIEFFSPTEIKKIQKKNLIDLLRHAYENCPYYTDILTEAEVIKDNNIIIDNFVNIPILSKEIIRKNFNAISSQKKISKKVWMDTSGGSTGVPVKFLKDNYYWDYGIASHMFYMHMVGKEPGQKEIKLWGSERDTLKGKESFFFLLKNWLYNRKLLNSFKMTESDMKEYVDILNKIKPTSVWTYVESIYELARFIKSNNLRIFSPQAIVTTAGTLTTEIRNFIQVVFNTKVYNQYGSREVGTIAAECNKQEGLHVFEFSQYLEIIDKNGKEVATNEIGENIITCLTNFSFPLIRYRIEDTSIKKDKYCSCGRKLSLLKSVTGRTSDHFKTPNGTIIHGEYFTHLFYFRPWIKKFQVIQENLNFINVNIVLAGEKNTADIDEISKKIKHVIGPDCQINFNFVKEIQPSPSGKTRFTISKV